MLTNVTDKGIALTCAEMEENFKVGGSVSIANLFDAPYAEGVVDILPADMGSGTYSIYDFSTALSEGYHRFVVHVAIVEKSGGDMGYENVVMTVDYNESDGWSMPNLEAILTSNLDGGLGLDTALGILTYNGNPSISYKTAYRVYVS